MLSTWDPHLHALRPATVLPPSGWAHLAQPTGDELAALVASGVPRAFVDHALDRDEVPRVDRDDGHLLVILRVPLATPTETLPFRTTTVAVFVGGPCLVTLSREPLDLSEGLPHGAVAPEAPNRFLLQLVALAAARFQSCLRSIERDVDRLEDALQASLRNREVLELLKYQKALVHFTTGLSGNEILLSRLQRDPRLGITPADTELLEDVQVELRQAIEVTRIAGDILSQMMDAFASIISNNLNVVMKVLTSLTILLSVPTLLASFYGMNVPLPMQHHPLAFGALVGLSVLASLGLMVIFMRRRWL
ncbi:MAG: magnesium transporter CorA family protein [Myxococcaceae bacterium]|nr:magnesium transporter CorA family protein [Myxococcaceae bacterium]MCA3011109.1 magnesium transporter CorA family protein [Myxococcaceae bacterium]